MTMYPSVHYACFESDDSQGCEQAFTAFPQLDGSRSHVAKLIPLCNGRLGQTAVRGAFGVGVGPVPFSVREHRH